MADEGKAFDIKNLASPFAIFQYVASKLNEINFNDLFKQTIEAPYDELGKHASRALSLFPPVQEEWSYAIDTATGLKILKTTKNPRALDEISKIAETLYE